MSIERFSLGLEINKTTKLNVTRQLAIKLQLHSDEVPSTINETEFQLLNLITM